jgi:hypothetical protein
MDSGWAEFISQNASAIFALVGALGGGILSFIGALLLKKRDFSLATSAKLLERRISAHENVVALATEMRVMYALGGLSNTGEVRRAPQVMLSRETFENWVTRFTQLSISGTSWLSTGAKREVNFVQDYLVTLNMYLEGVPSDKFLSLGEVIRQDFVDLSSTLEKAAFKFFQHGVRKVKLPSLDEWHKYKRSETEQRLGATVLVNNQAVFMQAGSDDHVR